MASAGIIQLGGCNLHGRMAIPAPVPRVFWRLWSASMASNLADGIRSAAFPLLAAAISRDPLAVAMVAVAQQLPWLLLGLWGGVVADRVDGRKLIWRVNAVRTALLVGLLAAILTGATTMVLLLVVAFALGSAEAIVDSAYPSLVVATVGDDRLEWANARLVAGSVMGNELVGPAIGSWLFAVGLALPIAVDSGLVAASAMFILSLPILTGKSPSAPAVGKTRGQIREGVRWLMAHRGLRVVTVAGAVLALLDSAWYAVLVLFVLDELNFAEAGFGALLAVAAVGGLAGSVLAGRISRRTSVGVRLAAAVIVAGMTQFVVGLSSGVVVVGLMLAVSSGAFAVWNVTAATLRQRVVAIGMLGRVSATYTTALVGSAAAGAALGGLLASAAGLRAPMLIGGPILMAIGIWLWTALKRESPLSS